MPIKRPLIPRLGLLVSVGLAAFHWGCGNESVVLIDSGIGGQAEADSSIPGGEPVVLFDFTTGVQGWTINPWQGLDSAGLPTGSLNMGGTFIPSGIAPPTIGHDPVEGDSPGSLRIAVTFSDYNQSIVVSTTFGKANLQNWTGRKVNVRCKLDTIWPGGGVQLFAQDDTYSGIYPWNNMPVDTDWHVYTLDLTGNTSPMNTARILTFNFQIASGSMPASGSEAPVLTPTKITALIDSISLE